MIRYPEDDPKLLNPNRLEGHEGYMLRVLESMKGYIGCNKDSLYPWDGKGLTEIPSDSIVMILGVGYVKNADDQGWLDVLHEGERVRIFHQPSQWMRKFIPWPHGAFIKVSVEN